MRRATLLRFLKARKYDPQAAADQLEGESCCCGRCLPCVLQGTPAPAQQLTMSISAPNKVHAHKQHWCACSSLLAPCIARQPQHVPRGAGTVKWRQENGVDSYLAQFPDKGKDRIIRRCIPTGWAGFDKQVCAPVCAALPLRAAARKALASVPACECVRGGSVCRACRCGWSTLQPWTS